MSEVMGMPDSDCARVRASFAALVDGDLNPAQSTWTHEHLEVCGECRAAHESFVALDGELIGWGAQPGRENPPPPGQKALLAICMTEPAPHRVKRWMPAVVLAAAAAVLLAIFISQKAPDTGIRGGIRDNSQFVDIPYLAPLDPRENATIVRMDIQVATLMSLGYRVAADPDEVVPADVLVGEDGRAHAVRVISGIDLDGARGD